MKEKWDKELYRELRRRRPEELWAREVAAFNGAAAEERLRNVAVVRAVGVVFSEKGSEEEKERAREWLRGLLGERQERTVGSHISKLGGSRFIDGDVRKAERLGGRSSLAERR